MDLSYKHIWKVSSPIFISMLLQQIVSITDVIFLGHLGEIALSGAALGATYFLTVYMVAIGFSMGAQIIMARRNGEAEFDKIGPIFFQATSCLLAASVVIIFSSYIFSPKLLNNIISSQDIYQTTVDYINWRFWGFLPLFVIIMLRAFFISITKTNVLTFVSLVAVFSNILLNYLLIFGNLGFPKLGISGAAIASVLAEMISLICLIFYTFSVVDLKKFGLTKWIYRDFSLIKEILNLSVWTMIQQFISIGCWFLFFLAIEHLGALPLAASNILRSISSFPYIVICALAITCGTFVSNLIGANQQHKIIFCCNRIIIMAFGATLVLISIFAIFRNPILALYTSNPALIDFSKTAYLVMLGAQIAYIPSLILFNAMLGAGLTKKAMFIEFVANIAYLVHVWWVIVYLKADIAWCWTTDYTCYVLILLMSAYYMYGNKWCCKKV